VDFLCEACGDNVELRREVESLLAAHAEAGAFAERPAIDAVVSLGLLNANNVAPALSPGFELGSYRIVNSLGSGGMGEVYRALDTRLQREVAVKVLPVAVSSDPGRVARLQREARLLAALNHPHIATIYGLEEAQGVHALVMELIRGESPKGPMSFLEAWKIAAQIAGALDYAHEKGIVHRDLKPANVKVTPDGVVKLLDFGLAKAYSDAPDVTGTDPGDSPTFSLGRTVPGVILGTASYMAPEQARGKIVDRRADIWAFGCVLYELLTGEQLFQGQDLGDTLAAVIKDEPDLSRAPVQAQRLLKSCLEKDPKNRLRDIGDACRLIEDGTEILPRHNRARKTVLPWTLATLFALAAFVLGYFEFHQPLPARRVLRYTIPAPENTTDLHSFAISPDARLVAIAAEGSGKRQLWLRALDAPQVQPVPDTEGATYPFWSPDSSYIGFFAQGKLKKISASGGTAQPLCDAPDARSGSWSREDVILFSSVFGALRRVPAKGGVPVDLPGSNGSFLYPVFLADGRHFLYTHIDSGKPDQEGVYLAEQDGKESRLIPGRGAARGVVFAPGYLLFVRVRTLMAQPFDAVRGQMTGEAFPVAEGVSATSNGSYEPISVSETGVLLYQTSSGAAATQLAWYDRSGKPLDVATAGSVLGPAISPDGRSIAFSRASARGFDLWLRDLTSRVEQRLTADPSPSLAPFWSRNGDRIVFHRALGGIFNLYQRAASAAGKDELLLVPNGNNRAPFQWSRDGRFVVYSEIDPKTKRDIWVLPMQGGAERKPLAFLHSEFNEIFGQLSPDSHWMAYTSDESGGQREVYVRSFPAGDYQKRISIAGGEQPRWRGDGKELFFVGADGKMMAVPIIKAMAGPKPTFETAAPETLFDAHMLATTTPQFEYDVTADGKRFLINSISGSSASAPYLNVVVNWDGDLKK
jgi:serine/threonine protein kinase